MNGGELFLQPKRPVEPMDSFLGVCRGTRHQITSSCQPSVERSGDPAEHFGIPEGCILVPRECFGHVLTMHAKDDKLSLVCAVLVPTPGALGGSLLMVQPRCFQAHECQAVRLQQFLLELIRCWCGRALVSSLDSNCAWSRLRLARAAHAQCTETYFHATV